MRFRLVVMPAWKNGLFHLPPSDMTGWAREFAICVRPYALVLKVWSKS